jgi:hypothetical protein
MNPFENLMSRRTMMAVTAGSLTAVTAAKAQVGSAGIDLSTPRSIGNPASLSLVASAGSPDATQTTVALSTTWKFQEDPTNTGLTSAWYITGFNDSGWGTLLSGHTWESQSSGYYSGYAWYRQDGVVVNYPMLGQWLVLTLARLNGDDLAYWNGNLIGGISGGAKYANTQNRTYYIPPSTVQSSNTIAIRCWGGNLNSASSSGLIAGTYTLATYAGPMWGRPSGGPVESELPVEAFDLSDAQRGMAWDLVLRINSADIPSISSPAAVYTITDFYGATLSSGSVPVTVGVDGINRAVVPISGSLTAAVYLAGRFNISYQIAPSGQASAYTDTGLTIVSAACGVTEQVWSINLSAGRVDLQPLNVGQFVGMNTIVIPDPTVVLGNLVVNDVANAAHWSLKNNLQVGDALYGDLSYPISALGVGLAGAQWIRTAAASKLFAGNPAASFTIDRPATVYIGVDRRASSLPWIHVASANQLSFVKRDTMPLPALATELDATPFGSLKLVDHIDCSTPIVSEQHPYMQSGIEPYRAVSFHTPGSSVPVAVSTILGRQARHVDYGFFAYRVGAGGLTPGKQYLLAVTYPEDVPRYVELEVQAGQGYFDVGWKSGLPNNNIYDPWPLSGAWQTFYQVFTLGSQTTAAGGTEAGDARNGVWVYFLGVVHTSGANQFWGNYCGGPAVGEIKLYEIDPVANAPVITLPASLPKRLLTFDWERPPAQPPQDLCGYARLMGYNAISPLVGAKWGTDHYSDPLAGYNTFGQDPQNWPYRIPYVKGSGTPPPSPFPATPSFHKQFLDATAAAGLDYYPRFEYGGSIDLPTAAFSINAAGVPSKPDRYPAPGPITANVLHPAVYSEIAALFDNMVKPYTGYSNFKGLLWRQRKDTMPISYGASDIARFTADTGNAPPARLTAAQLANWASTGAIQPLYATWWHVKRAAFHYAVLGLLRSYRRDMILMYYNWDTDKFGILKSDQNDYLGAYRILEQHGAAYYFSTDLAARLKFTPTDYTTALHDGNFAPPNIGLTRPDALWPDYGIRPEFYTKPGVKVFCPLNSNCYASQQYLQYFQTADGLAVSHAVSYAEIDARGINPKYEGTMVVPGGAPFSMALEVLSWAYGDARTLTYTAYTFARGFADAHRRFAQAFLALPAVPGTLVAGTDPDVAARVYPGLKGSFYIGVAYKGYVAKTLSVSIPGMPVESLVTNLVAGAQATATWSGGNLILSINTQPMELDAYRVDPPPLQGGPANITPPQIAPRVH